jgi:hypothetical protein
MKGTKKQGAPSKGSKKDISKCEEEREIWVGKNRLYLDDEGILHVTLIGEVDMEMAIELNQVYYRFLEMIEGELNCFVDLNKAGKQSSEVRRKGREILDDERIGKTALFGLHPVAKVLASFVMGVTEKKDISFFKTKEEALAWLKE